MKKKGSLSVELTIKAMQRQLLQISDRIPDDILLTLLKCFAQILSREPETSSTSGPFIRAFAKKADVNADKLDEDEDQSKTDENGDTECTFNYKVSNVVTQEVVYSVGNGSDMRDEDGNLINDEHDHEMPQLLDPDESPEVIDEKFEEISKENGEEDGSAAEKQENQEINLENGEPVVNSEELETVQEEVAENFEESVPIEEPQPENQQEEPQINEPEPTADESEKPQIDEQNIQSEVEEPPQPQEEREILPMQTVSLDDIQREIQEMQMFLLNKGIVPEQKVKSHVISKKLKKLEDSFKVDFCLDLKKRTNERASRSKAILANYVNDHGRKSKSDKRTPIFDPSVPNTPEDFLKEKSVSEKINKKKQKIKHLDVSWQKLCDSQKKVYK